MIYRQILCAAGLLGAMHAFARTTSPPSGPVADSAAVVTAIHRLEPWIGDELGKLRTCTDLAEVHAIAGAIAQRTDSLATCFRQVFPDEDDGMAMFGLYSGLAASVQGCNPGLAAVYRGAATSALLTGDAPWRPAMYQALSTIADRSAALARAKRPERVQRLIDKLQADHVDLTVSL